MLTLSVLPTGSDGVYLPGDLVSASVLVHDDDGDGNGEDGTAGAGLELVARAAGTMRVDPAWRPAAYAALAIPGALRRRASSSSPSELTIFRGEASAAVLRAGGARAAATFRLPEPLPPTFSGAAVKFAYFIEVSLRPAGGGEALSTIRVRPAVASRRRGGRFAPAADPAARRARDTATGTAARVGRAERERGLLGRRARGERVGRARRGRALRRGGGGAVDARWLGRRPCARRRR